MNLNNELNITAKTGKAIKDLAVATDNEWADVCYLLMQARLIGAIMMDDEKYPERAPLKQTFTTAISGYATVFLQHRIEKELGGKLLELTGAAAAEARKRMTDARKKLIADTEVLCDVAIGEITEISDDMDGKKGKGE